MRAVAVAPDLPAGLLAPWSAACRRRRGRRWRAPQRQLRPPGAFVRSGRSVRHRATAFEQLRDRALERPPARRVVDEHVEAGRGRAEQHRAGRSSEHRFARQSRSARRPLPRAWPGASRVWPRPAAWNAAAKLRPALADEHRGVARSRDHGRQRVDGQVLGAAAADEHQRPRKAAQRRDHGVGLRALRVVDVADAVDSATGSSRCSTPRNPATAAPDARRGQRRRAGPTATAASDVADGVPAGQRDRSSGRIRPVEPVMPSARSAARHGRRTIQPSTTPTSPGRCRCADSADAGRALAARHMRDDRVLGVEHEAPVGRHELGEAALDRAVRLERRRGDRGDRRSRGCRRDPSVPRDRVGSCSSDSSSTTRCARVSSGRRSTSGTPMLPPSSTGVGRCAPGWPRSATMVVVLPFVPVTPTIGAGQSRRNRSTSLTTGTTAVALELRQRRAEPWLGRRVVAADRRRGRHQRRSASASEGSTSGPSSSRTLAGRRAASDRRRPALRGRDRRRRSPARRGRAGTASARRRCARVRAPPPGGRRRSRASACARSIGLAWPVALTAAHTSVPRSPRRTPRRPSPPGRPRSRSGG